MVDLQQTAALREKLLPLGPSCSRAAVEKSFSFMCLQSKNIIVFNSYPFLFVFKGHMLRKEINQFEFLSFQTISHRQSVRLIEKRQASIAPNPRTLDRRTGLVGCLKGIALQFAILPSALLAFFSISSTIRLTIAYS